MQNHTNKYEPVYLYVSIYVWVCVSTSKNHNCKNKCEIRFPWTLLYEICRELHNVKYQRCTHDIKKVVKIVGRRRRR